MGAVLLCAMYALAQRRQASVIEAVHKGHAVGHEQDGMDAVRLALAAGGNVNERDESGWTPLMHAALECRPQIVKLLLGKGADVSLRANTKATPSYMDSGQQALGIAAGCFIARRRAELAPSRGMPPAYVESELSAPETMVRDLIAHGAPVNVADSDGRTPLMMAVMQGWARAVKELISHRAAVNDLDHEGRLAIDYADPGNREIAALLQGAGSNAPTKRSGRTICDAERALDQRGYDMPIIDCISGQEMRAAITNFQKDSHLRPTGELDLPTRKALAIR
jgi:ankyrin repeat protein